MSGFFIAQGVGAPNPCVQESTVIARTWEHFEYPISNSRKPVKLWYLYTMEYYLAVRMVIR